MNFNQLEFNGLDEQAKVYIMAKLLEGGFSHPFCPFPSFPFPLPFLTFTRLFPPPWSAPQIQLSDLMQRC